MGIREIKNNPNPYNCEKGIVEKIICWAQMLFLNFKGLH